MIKYQWPIIYKKPSNISIPIYLDSPSSKAYPQDVV